MNMFMGVLFGIAFIAAGVYLVIHGHLYLGGFCLVAASLLEIKSGNSRLTQ